MTENLESKPSSDLFISFHLPQDPKAFFSSQISPKTMPETPSGISWLSSFKEEYMPSLKPDSSEKCSSQKLRGLEEIGLFSEFQFSKSYKNIDGEGVKRGTINLSDFMVENNKRNILKNAGGWERYFFKRKEFGKETVLREKHAGKFFCHSEKKPEFFFTPPVSPRVQVSSKRVKTGKLDVIQGIMHKCDEAIAIKLPKNVHKSISPKIWESDFDRNWKNSSLKVGKKCKSRNGLGF
jgi:hypothetical protein